MTERKVAGVRVPERAVPFPRSISAEAQAFLRAFVDEDGNLLRQSGYPEPTDTAAWKAMQREMDALMTVMMGQMPIEAGATVETVTIGDAMVYIATPAAPKATDRVYYDIHGGGLVFGAGEACRIGALVRASQFGVPCYAVDYRMPPEHPYPAGLDDCVAVYRALLDKFGAENIAMGGASAGGNLAAATALRARDEGLALPSSLVLLTPELDLTESGDSFETNHLHDVVLPRSLMSANLLYADGAELTDPYLSPLFGDFTKGFPPTFLQTGTRDLFLSNTVRMHRALLKAGIPVELHVFEGMPHGGFTGSPESAEAAAETARFVWDHWA